MALRLNRTVFIHIPKTGGLWSAAVFRKLGAIQEETSHPHVKWSEILEDAGKKAWHGLKPFAFVRHPVTWYRSYWAYKNRVGWQKGNRLDDECGAPDFLSFATNCATRLPGYLSGMYTRFAVGVEVIHRFEALREGLLEALQEEGFSEIPEVPPVNASPSFPECPSHLAEAIEKSEARAMETWGYSSINPKGNACKL